jgi:signal transduction histidine kinase
VAPDFEAITAAFYERIESDPVAARVLEQNAADVARLRATLVGWLRELITGPWGPAYFERREQIGRRHVALRMPQHLNYTAMSVLRGGLCRACHARAPDPATARRWALSVDKLLDLELAIILRTYTEDHEVQLRRTERLATFGLLTSAIGHELRNPLGVIESSAFLLRKRLGDDPVAQRHADKIQGQVARSNRIITGMLEIIRDRTPNRVRVTAQALAERAAAEVLADRGFAVELNVAADVPRIVCDPEQIHQVLQNLIANAIEAAGADGEVCLCVTRSSDDVELVVEDDGPGVDARVRGRLFEPLVTSKNTGVGLGLALCQKLVEANGGTIELRAPRMLSGAAFAIVLKGAQPA